MDDSSVPSIPGKIERVGEDDWAIPKSADDENAVPNWIASYKAALEDERVEEEAAKQQMGTVEPINYAKKLDAKGRAYGTGRRKASVARVWISPGSGEIKINYGDAEDYMLQRDSWLDHIQEPFASTETEGKFDVWCTATGGGLTGTLLFNVYVAFLCD
jgi:small subunit ribosomal protein S9